MENCLQDKLFTNKIYTPPKYDIRIPVHLSRPHTFDMLNQCNRFHKCNMCFFLCISIYFSTTKTKQKTCLSSMFSAATKLDVFTASHNSVSKYGIL